MAITPTAPQSAMIRDRLTGPGDGNLPPPTVTGMPAGMPSARTLASVAADLRRPQPRARLAFQKTAAGELDSMSLVRIERETKLGLLGNKVQAKRLREVPLATQNKLIAQMGEHFFREWNEDDPQYDSPPAVESILRKRIAENKSNDFAVVKFNAENGELLHTARLCPRDSPRFDDTGPLGPDGKPTDKYGENWLADVYTGVDWRGIGLASKGIRDIQAHAKAQGLKEIYLYTTPDKKVHYYQELGFEVVGHENASEPGEPPNPQVIMRYRTGA